MVVFSLVALVQLLRIAFWDGMSQSMAFSFQFGLASLPASSPPRSRSNFNSKCAHERATLASYRSRLLA